MPEASPASASGNKNPWGTLYRYLVDNGQYDGVVIDETSDEETANRLLMKIGMQGNI